LSGSNSPAPLHLDNMPAHIAIVGTDFEQQTLIDKDVSVVFCNPPYSQYEQWAVKIIKEALCNTIYLIIPNRWADSGPIAAALESRGTKARVLWSGDFTNAERRARATVDILSISLNEADNGYGCRAQKKDPFDTWFAETFPEVEKIDHVPEESPVDVRMNTEIMQGYNLVDRLVILYKQDLERMRASYRSLCAIDPALLATIGVKAEQIKDGLKQKIQSLKNLYWKELFDHLDKITARLTHDSREAIVKKMASAVHVDFTSDNAYAVVLWVLKNANEYIEDQLTGLFKKLSHPDHVKRYKSNQKTWGNEQWRYLRNPQWNDGGEETPSRYMLDYRIVYYHYQAIKPNSGETWRHSDYDYPGGLHTSAHQVIGDIITIANNLGFPAGTLGCYSDSRQRAWASGQAEEFYLNDGEPLVRVRAFINGNMHFQFNQKFIKALNVEASRLLGWIRTPQEAATEMGIGIDIAQKYFNVNRIFAASDCKLLTA